MCFAGYNSTIFAYGQTGSGKTHTMLGSESDPGLARQAVDHIFSTIEESPQRMYLLSVSYMEIYNEGVFDLLSEVSPQWETHSCFLGGMSPSW